MYPHIFKNFYSNQPDLTLLVLPYNEPCTKYYGTFIHYEIGSKENLYIPICTEVQKYSYWPFPMQNIRNETLTQGKTTDQASL